MGALYVLCTETVGVFLPFLMWPLSGGNPDVGGQIRVGAGWLGGPCRRLIIYSAPPEGNEVQAESGVSNGSRGRHHWVGPVKFSERFVCAMWSRVKARSGLLHLFFRPNSSHTVRRPDIVDHLLETIY